MLVMVMVMLSEICQVMLIVSPCSSFQLVLFLLCRYGNVICYGLGYDMVMMQLMCNVLALGYGFENFRIRDET